MKRALELTAALALLAAMAPAATAQTAVNGDLAKLQGKWTAFIGTPRGKLRVVLEFKENFVYTTMSNGPFTKPDSVAEIVLDETKSPKQMLLRNAKPYAPVPGSLQEKLTLPDTLAIYELSGDTWTTCATMFGKTYPTKFAAGKEQTLSVYKRGELELPKEATRKGQAKADDRNTKILVGAKVTNPQRTTATLITAEGEAIEVVTNHAKIGIDLEGNKATQMRNFYNEGNVVDVTLRYLGPQKKPAWEISEIRMISGVFEYHPPARPTEKAMPKTAATTKPKAKPKLRPEQISRRATVGKAFKEYYELFIDGELFKIYADNPQATAFDASGKKLPRHSESKMLKEGNIVDVSFWVKNKAHPYYSLSEIHLIQGEMR